MQPCPWKESVQGALLRRAGASVSGFSLRQHLLYCCRMFSFSILEKMPAWRYSARRESQLRGLLVPPVQFFSRCWKIQRGLSRGGPPASLSSSGTALESAWNWSPQPCGVQMDTLEKKMPFSYLSRGRCIWLLRVVPASSCAVRGVC